MKFVVRPRFDYVNKRATPSSRGEALGQLVAPLLVDHVSREGAWLLVRLSNERFFLHAAWAEFSLSVSQLWVHQAGLTPVRVDDQVSLTNFLNLLSRPLDYQTLTAYANPPVSGYSRESAAWLYADGYLSMSVSVHVARMADWTPEGAYVVVGYKPSIGEDNNPHYQGGWLIEPRKRLNEFIKRCYTKEGG